MSRIPMTAVMILSCVLVLPLTGCKEVIGIDHSQGEMAGEVTRDSAILILNDYEFEMYKKKTELSDEGILELTEVVIVTLGEKGARIVTRETTYEIPVATVRSVMDPTGVGDAFRAGLMKGMVSDLGWEISGRMGSLAAAYVLETDGPQSHAYTLDQFTERYCRDFGETASVRSLSSKS